MYEGGGNLTSGLLTSRPLADKSSKAKVLAWDFLLVLGSDHSRVRASRPISPFGLYLGNSGEDRINFDIDLGKRLCAVPIGGDLGHSDSDGGACSGMVFGDGMRQHAIRAPTRVPTQGQTMRTFGYPRSC